MTPNPPGDATRPAASSPPPPPQASLEGRFVPGAMLHAGRYRILNLLGQGGMGEVYKAEDLKLRQIVALKFLPLSASLDPAALARFHNEVRIARQVAHPAVCRVYDIGEEHGQHFLSMEFIDGEDLASLLRRIGRLPGDKATQIGREICAGLAAAHDQGVLHRDLKPANIMIDGRGKARITDFGLAVLHGEVRGPEALAGTPAYMSPEQLSGREATARSDIYALGLVLYEIFTGRRTFEAETWREFQSLHQSSQPSTPSTHVKDIDPIAERVILRCLEKDPQNRPPSASQVGLALPGGDPLLAAMAAGETPSPEMVAATARTGSLRFPVALAFLAISWAAIWFLLANPSPAHVHTVVPLRKSPEVLADRASELIQSLGYTTPPADRFYSYTAELSYWEHLLRNQRTAEFWPNIRTGQPLTFFFWYRQSPQYLAADPYGFVNIDNPPESVPGMAHVLFDPNGRLIEFSAVPDPKSTLQPATIDWRPLFIAAGLSLDRFTPASPEQTPPHYAATRVAWTGPHPDHPAIPLRIEAAANQSRVVWFHIGFPWDGSERRQSNRADISGGLSGIFELALISLFIVVALFLARHNLRLGRADRRGAFRLGIAIFVCAGGSRLFAAHLVSGLPGFAILRGIAAFSLLYAAFAWVGYLALEPYIRRYWPNLLVGWTRLLSGDPRDPMVGRDLLVGGCLGLMGHALIANLGIRVEALYSPVPPLAIAPPTNWQELLSNLLTFIPMAVYTAIFIALIFSLAYIPLRRPWAAALLTALLSFAYLSVTYASSVPLLVATAIQAATGVICLARYGLLALATYMLFFFSIWLNPGTLDTSLWYAGFGFFFAALLAAVSFYGFHTSLGAQKPWQGKLQAL
ncbi:MAG: serine/threonine-protein kinase [Bryobacteraceae bacterium]